MTECILSTNFKDIPIFRKGKVRDVYDLGDKLLIIATDRISAFDVVMPNGIPNKGKILTQMTLFWFQLIKEIVPVHLLTSNIREYPKNLQAYSSILEGRSMIVKKTKVIPIECIVRGYLSGSGWKEYQQNQTICKISLPKGLVESDALPNPIFTPSTKAEEGLHDQNISVEETEKIIGTELTEKIKNISLKIYNTAKNYALKKGIIIADTKFEFGLLDGQVILIDEILTPDSSRFWPVEFYQPGHGQPSFDKQFVRDYLEEIKWNKKPPAPTLPEDIIEKTAKKYEEALQKLVS